MTHFQLTILVVLLCTIILLQIALYTQRARAVARSNKEDKPGPDRKPAARPQPAAAVPASRDAEPRQKEENHRASGGALRAVAAGIGSVIGRKKPEEPIEEPPVELTLPNDAGGQADQVHLLKARHSPGFDAARLLVEQALLRHGTMMTLDFQGPSVAVRYMVDEVWHVGEPPEFDSAAAALESLKTLCGLECAEGQARQRGRFAAVYESVRYEATMAAQVARTGQRVVVQFSRPEKPLATFADVGLPPRIEAALRGLLNGGRGILLLSAAPASGLRTTTTVLLNAMDRLQRDAISVEDQNARYPAIEAVDVRTYSSAEGQCPADLLPLVFHRDPTVVVIRDLVNGRTIDELCEGLEGKPRLAVATVRAGGCVEALLRVLLLRGDRARFSAQITAVLNQRLIRKLCDACKKPYSPKPQILRELGIRQAAGRPFYRPPSKSDPPCPACGGIGYVGRTGLFELLVIGDQLRQQLVVAPKPDLVAAAAVEDGMRPLREEGAQLVADGVTSVAELARVLKLFPVQEPAAGTPAI